MALNASTNTVGNLSTNPTVSLIVQFTFIPKKALPTLVSRVENNLFELAEFFLVNSSKIVLFPALV